MSEKPPASPTDPPPAGTLHPLARRKYYSLPKRAPTDPAPRVTEESEPPRPLVVRLCDFFTCRFCGIERVLLFIIVPIGLIVAIILALTAQGR